MKVKLYENGFKIYANPEEVREIMMSTFIQSQYLGIDTLEEYMQYASELISGDK